MVRLVYLFIVSCCFFESDHCRRCSQHSTGCEVICLMLAVGCQHEM